MNKFILSDCLESMRTMEENSVDSIVTDPPAGISFMNQAWDDDKGGRDQWVAWLTSVMKEALRVLKPGGHALVWAFPRTSHWTGKALEDAGFEVRDVITHLFGTGFPKSLDISKAIDKAAGAEREVVGVNPNHRGESQMRNPYTKSLGQDGSITAPSTDAAKQWQGFGTALKPAAEFWFLVRKPLSEKTVAANVLKWGTGGINIDGCRIKLKEGETYQAGGSTDGSSIASMQVPGWDRPWKHGEDAKNKNKSAREAREEKAVSTGRFPANLILDETAAAMLDSSTVVSQSAEGPSRFFYVAKASKSDKGEVNTHPTVKSTALMEYLIKLVTPPGGTVLDMFMGSGSTGVAAQNLGFSFIGIEQQADYLAIAERRCGT